MKKWLSGVLFCIFLSGCTSSETTNYEYTFTGESEYWEAEYKERGTGETAPFNEVEDELIVTYKGPIEELATTGLLSYSFQSTVDQASVTSTFDQPLKTKRFFIQGGSKNRDRTNKGEVVIVKVRWNGKFENIELHRMK
ncbi:hypothetical protein [Rossellomorea aquimaris]|uniref:hypothetical protein n=1 Tax=Rossellomorea aquimaris TaxID=189382 RepID=UPI0005CB4837|nr:hypothetical protein [Rossellomorea aquimaris]